MTSTKNPFKVTTDLAHLVLERTGRLNGIVRQRMTAKEQLALFGVVIGRGTIVIDGASEYVYNRVKVCFGHDYDDRNFIKWTNLGSHATR